MFLLSAASILPANIQRPTPLKKMEKPDVQPEATFAPTTRGGSKLKHDGYVYRYRETNKDGTVSWKCDLDSQKFRRDGRAKTSGRDEGATVIAYTKNRRHLPDPTAENARAVVATVKRVAVEQPAATTHQVLAASVRGAPEEVLAQLNSKKTLKRAAQRARQADRKKRLVGSGEGSAPNDRSRQELHIPPHMAEFNGESFLRFDSGPGNDRIVIFGSSASAEFLSKCKTWGADGTFKVAPAIFAQLYTVHGHENGFVVPALYCLLPNKTAATYDRMWGAIKSIIPQEINEPINMAADFEVAAFAALATHFPGPAFWGCLFHLAQSVDRKVVELGLRQRYLGSPEFRRAVKSLVALAFFPRN